MNQLFVDRDRQRRDGDEDGDGDVGIIQTVAFLSKSVPQKLDGHKHRQVNRSKSICSQKLDR